MIIIYIIINVPNSIFRQRARRSLNILDTAADAAFDRITEAASTITHSPIALVSLVDSDRQWFKSKVGLNVSETRREVAFCSHAIAQCDSKIFVVNDALQDERFKKNHLVVGAPNIRFYAGVPLIVDGNDCQYKIGCDRDRQAALPTQAVAAVRARPSAGAGAERLPADLR